MKIEIELRQHRGIRDDHEIGRRTITIPQWNVMAKLGESVPVCVGLIQQTPQEYATAIKTSVAAVTEKLDYLREENPFNGSLYLASLDLELQGMIIKAVEEKLGKPVLTRVPTHIPNDVAESDSDEDDDE